MAVGRSKMNDSTTKMTEEEVKVIPTDILKRLLLSLPQSEVCRLRWVEGRSVAEIAEKRNRSRQAIYLHLRKALLMLGLPVRRKWLAKALNENH